MTINKITTANGTTFEVSDEVAVQLLREQLGLGPKKEVTVDVEHITRALTSPQRAAWEVLREYPEGIGVSNVGTMLGITSGAAGERLRNLVKCGLAQPVGHGRYAPAEGAI